MTSYEIPDEPKMLRETLCLAQGLIARGSDPRRVEHSDRLQRLINECDRHRPLSPDGKHGDRHTPTCGCEDQRLCPRCFSPRWVAVSLDGGHTRRAQCVPCGAVHAGMLGTDEA